MIFTKFRDTKSPERANATDAGIDFYVPNFSDEYVNALMNIQKGITCLGHINVLFNDISEEFEIRIKPEASVLIPTGIKVIVDEETALVAMNKSGIAAKQSLVLGSCVIDNGYSGEVIINLHNISGVDQYIRFGQKITQFVQLKINTHKPVEVTDEEYEEIVKQEKSDRGSGGFGSTGI
jgi:deoxyuridine 5'-triphosphate nucleotidohydrolase